MLHLFDARNQNDMISSVNLLVLPNPIPVSIFAPKLFSPSPSSPPWTSPAEGRSGRCRCRRGGGGSRWDANAEPLRAGRFRSRDGGKEEKRRRRWWSEDDDDESADEEGFDPFEDYDDDPQPWDVIWIFKQVFRSYGYLLPAIIASMLLATGPKAFLMALALPLGQSAISLAVEKLWGKDTEEPQIKRKNKKKPFTNYTRDYDRRWPDENSYDNDGKPGYQSWVATDGGIVDKGNASSGPSLGGWDELDTRGGGLKGYTRRQPYTGKGSPKSEPRKKGKLFKKGKHKDTPLFLRLLIAVFPFLASWTRIL